MAKVTEANGSLLQELEAVQEQLFKVKKDNLCIRIGYERWKHTYENVNNINTYQDSSPVSKQETLADLKIQTSELLA